LLRLLEGYWPPPFRGGRTRAWQRYRRDRMRASARLIGKGTSLTSAQRSDLTAESIQRAGAAGRKLRQRFPQPEHLLRPTGLGNVLAAMEDSAGRPYGMDAVILWPRLYPLLSEPVLDLVSDRRDMLDAAARMAATMLVTAVTTGVLLWGAGWWKLLALAPLGVGVLSYLGAVQAALAYAEAVHVAFDLHRGDLLTALRMPAPTSLSQEQALGAGWSDFWRQGIPFRPDLTYSTDSTAAGKSGT
jgi:hypothetical protein